MARLILKSPYLQCDRNHPVSGYLQYIGTRERVELLPDDRPPTRKQEQLVRKLTKDFPEAKKLGEYLDYESKPTSDWGITASLGTRMVWIWRKQCGSWISTPAMCGPISSP